MYSTKEEYGSFVVTGYTNIVTVTICNEASLEDYVKMAIKFAKHKKCTIHRQVEYHPELVGGSISFDVLCNSKTNVLVYQYGHGFGSKNNNPSVTQKDLDEYRQRFGTTKCNHPGFKKKFWYSDNWTGQVHYFDDLKEAKKEAKKETGESVSIYTNKPCCYYGSFVCYAEASGITPP